MTAFARTKDESWRPIADSETFRLPPKREVDPDGLAAHDPGAKLDFGKAPVVRGAIKYFPRALLAVGDLSKHGAEKYAWRGWEAVADGIQRYDDAIGRHMIGEAIEGELDQTWKAAGKDVLHATSVAWNALARLELILREKENANGTEALSVL